MDNKISTSVQYQVSNIALFDEIYRNWTNFDAELKKGPAEMKLFLLNLWNRVREEIRNDASLEVKDIDKEVTVDDFDVTINRTIKGVPVFYITFPDYEYRDAASKYVALALTPNMPRYFTLEYSENIMDSTPQWVVGEFVIENGNKVHVNHATTDNMRLSWFAGYVLGKLEQENL